MKFLVYKFENQFPWNCAIASCDQLSIEAKGLPPNLVKDNFFTPDMSTSCLVMSTSFNSGNNMSFKEGGDWLGAKYILIKSKFDKLKKKTLLGCGSLLGLLGRLGGHNDGFKVLKWQSVDCWFIPSHNFQASVGPVLLLSLLLSPPLFSLRIQLRRCFYFVEGDFYFKYQWDFNKMRDAFMSHDKGKE